jgi:FkbM family methyltransferase
MGVIGRFVRFFKPAVEQIPAAAMAYRYIRDSNLRMVEPRDTPLGFKFAGHPAMEQGTFEPAETRIVMRFLEKIDVVINVGANTGYYCCLALHRGKRVIAFEPIGQNLQCLYRNVRANGWQDRIEIYPIALSDRIGIIDIFGGGTGASLVKGWAGIPERYAQLVPTSTLDNVLGERIQGRNCLFIIDVEGSEKLVLGGSQGALAAQPKPIWMVEISVRDHQPKGVTLNPHLRSTFQHFWDFEYEAWTAGESIRLVDPGEIEDIAAGREDTLRTHNFLFIERGRKSELIDD